MSDAIPGLVVGSEEEGRKWIGVPDGPVWGDLRIDQSMIKGFCGLIEDGHPRYWDPDPARCVAPPSMLMTATMELAWSPEQRPPTPPLCVRVPLPGDAVLNAGQEAEFFEPIWVGDRLGVTETVTAISETKTTVVGTGHFVTTEGRYEREDGTLVATLRNTLFRYRASDVS